jgi:replicative DNA helicase
MLDNQAWERVADVITSRDFYKGHHRIIYEHIELVLAADQPADVVTVSESMQAAGVLDHVGGPAYLGSLAQNTPSAVNIRRYAELVREKAIQRGVVRVGTEMAERA